MEVEHLNSSNFEELVLKSDKKVLVDFFATWCGPCKMLSPIIEDINKMEKDFLVYKLDVDEVPEIASKYEVMSIPNLLVFENGKVINRALGYMNKDAVLKLLK